MKHFIIPLQTFNHFLQLNAIEKEETYWKITLCVEKPNAKLYSDFTMT